jgi:hypothetical protein
VIPSCFVALRLDFNISVWLPCSLSSQSLLDSQIYYNVWWRSVIFTIVGAAMCYVAGTLTTNCCVMAPEFVIFSKPNDDEEGMHQGVFFPS